MSKLKAIANPQLEPRAGLGQQLIATAAPPPPPPGAGVPPPPPPAAAASTDDIGVVETWLTNAKGYVANLAGSAQFVTVTKSYIQDLLSTVQFKPYVDGNGLIQGLDAHIWGTIVDRVDRLGIPGEPGQKAVTMLDWVVAAPQPAPAPSFNPNTPTPLIQPGWGLQNFPPALDRMTGFLEELRSARAALANTGGAAAVAAASATAACRASFYAQGGPIDQLNQQIASLKAQVAALQSAAAAAAAACVKAGP